MTVTLHITQKAKNSTHISGLQRASKSLAAATATLGAAAKHMLFCQPGLHWQKNQSWHKDNKTNEIFTHVTTKGFDQIKCSIDTLEL